MRFVFNPRFLPFIHRVLRQGRPSALQARSAGHLAEFQFYQRRCHFQRRSESCLLLLEQAAHVSHVFQFPPSGIHCHRPFPRVACPPAPWASNCWEGWRVSAGGRAWVAQEREFFFAAATGLRFLADVAACGRSLCVDAEEFVQLYLSVCEVLLCEVSCQRLQRRPVRFDAVRPVIFAESPP